MKAHCRSRFVRLASAGLFLAAANLFPALHLALHERDHDHVGGGIRFHRHETPSEHRHGGRPHSHAPAAEPHSHHRPAEHRHADPDPDSSHGEGSLAHFALALGESGSFAVFEVSEPFVAVSAPFHSAEPSSRPGFLRPSGARGPPVA